MEESYIKWDKARDIKQVKEHLQREVAPKVKKWADKIIVGANVQPHYADRKEGEVWEDSDGKKWTRKGGIVQTVDKMTAAKTPWWCPRCEQPLDHWIHEKFWRLRGVCHRCITEDEHKIRMAGNWEAYEQKLMRENERAQLLHKIEEHETYIREFKEPTVYFENGGYQVIAKREEFEGLFSQLREDIEFCKAKLVELDELDKLEAQNENISDKKL